MFNYKDNEIFSIMQPFYRFLKQNSGYECKGCHSRQSLRIGTVMEHSKLPFRYWFVAMHLLTGTKKSFSASELQRQLGHKRFQPIWEMLHKLRNVMGKRDSKYHLSGQVELDNALLQPWYRIIKRMRSSSEAQAVKTNRK